MNAQSKDDWYDPAAATFGDRLAGARENAGMTQSELARRLGVKLQTLRSWENDMSEPRANKLSMMAGLLNVSLSWLLTGEGQGIEAPAELSGTPSDVADILVEIRDIKMQLTQSTSRLAHLEKALRAQFQGIEAA